MLLNSWLTDVKHNLSGFRSRKSQRRRGGDRPRNLPVASVEQIEDRLLLSAIGLVADHNSHSVVVFDVDTNTALGSVSLPGSGVVTGDVVMTDNGALGFVTDYNSRVWVIGLSDPTSPTVEPIPIAISIAGEDISITPDQRFLVISDGGTNAPLAVVDIASRTEVGTLHVGSDETSVEVSETGTVLTTSFNDDTLRRLTIDGAGNLTDTGDVLAVTDPMNAYSAPGGTTGIVLSFTGAIQSFRMAGLVSVDTRTLSGPGVSAVFSPAGDRVFVRDPGGSVNAFAFNATTGEMSASPLFTVYVGEAFTFVGIDQLAISPNGADLYVPANASDSINVYSAADGAFLARITHPNLGNPTGIAIAETGLSVTASDPVDGAVLTFAPTDFVITVNSPVDEFTVDPFDLTVDGTTADSVVVTGGTTLTFTFNDSPAASEGPHAIKIPHDAFARLEDGDGVGAFDATFRYDALLMQVTSTDPADGSVVLLPFTTLDLNFNEAFELASTEPGDFTLSQGSVTGISQVDPDTLHLTLSGVISEGTLIVNMPAGAMTDTFGNPGAAFSASYILDFGTIHYCSVTP